MPLITVDHTGLPDLTGNLQRSGLEDFVRDPGVIIEEVRSSFSTMLASHFSREYLYCPAEKRRFTANAITLDKFGNKGRICTYDPAVMDPICSHKYRLNKCPC